MKYTLLVLIIILLFLFYKFYPKRLESLTTNTIGVQNTTSGSQKTAPLAKSITTTTTKPPAPTTTKPPAPKKLAPQEVLPISYEHSDFIGSFLTF